MTEEETEIHERREQIYTLRRKIGSTYYQVTQIAIDNIPKLQKLHNMFKLKVIMIMANKELEEILDQTDLNITELNHLIYAAATVITEEVSGTEEYKSQIQRSKPPPWVRHIQGSIKKIRKDLSALIEIKRVSRKLKNIKRARLLKKNNTVLEDNLDHLIEELKQNVSAKMQQLCWCRKRQNQYYQNKLFRTECKKFYNHLGRHTPV
jgi:hypothetical protein